MKDDLVSRQATSVGCSLALEAHCGVAPPRHSDGYDSSVRLSLRSDSGAINRHLWLDATLGQSAPRECRQQHRENHDDEQTGAERT